MLIKKLNRDLFFSFDFVNLCYVLVAHRADILICAVFSNVRYLCNVIIYNKNDSFHHNINKILHKYIKLNYSRGNTYEGATPGAKKLLSSNFVHK